VTDAGAAAGVAWFEIWSADIERAKRWYGELFGWSFEPMTAYAADYWHIRGLPGVGGALVPGTPPSQPSGRHGSVVYFEVGDLEVTLDRAASSGGSIEQSRTAIGPGAGWFGIVRDPEGTRVGVWTDREARD
jgi:predicted enzyme related to lactoylglutathione lyase